MSAERWHSGGRLAGAGVRPAPTARRRPSVPRAGGYALVTTPGGTAATQNIRPLRRACCLGMVVPGWDGRRDGADPYDVRCAARARPSKQSAAGAC